VVPDDVTILYKLLNSYVSLMYIYRGSFTWKSGVVVVFILWKLDIQLPMQSVPITTNVVISNPAQARRTRYNIMW